MQARRVRCEVRVTYLASARGSSPAHIWPCRACAPPTRRPTPSQRCHPQTPSPVRSSPAFRWEPPQQRSLGAAGAARSRFTHEKYEVASCNLHAEHMPYRIACKLWRLSAYSIHIHSICCSSLQFESDTWKLTFFKPRSSASSVPLFT